MSEQQCRGCGDTFKPARKSTAFCWKEITFTCLNCLDQFQEKCQVFRPKFCSKDCRSYYSEAPLLSSHSLWDQVHPTRNSEIKLDQLRTNSHKVVWWLRKECGHEWDAPVRNRVAPHFGGCPICSNQRVLTGYNDLATVRPDLLLEWDYEKNIVSPTDVAPQSNQKFWWSCEHHESYDLPLNKKFHRPGCPICANRRLLPGFNDLAARYPEQAKEWSAKNEKLASEVFPGTLVKYLWECSDGHEYPMAPIKKCLDDRGCPICVNQVIVAGINDFPTTHPELLTHWDYDGNSTSPYDLSWGSNAICSWTCTKCNVPYEESVKSHFHRASSWCVACGGGQSLLEARVDEYLSELGIKRQRRLKRIRNNGKKLELDFTLPDLRLAIEVQDFATHSRDSENEELNVFWQERTGMLHKRGPAYHGIKRKLAKEQLGLTLIDIWEDEIRDGSFKGRIVTLLQNDTLV